MGEHTPSCELGLLQGEYESTDLKLATYTVLVARGYISKHLLGSPGFPSLFRVRDT